MSDSYKRNDDRQDKHEKDRDLRIAREFSQAIKRCLDARDDRKNGNGNKGGKSVR
jgi:hypothetical protein